MSLELHPELSVVGQSRGNMLRLLGTLLFFLILGAACLIGLGTVLIVAVIHIVMFSVLSIIVYFLVPRSPGPLPDFTPECEIAGIWPFDWFSPKDLRTNLVTITTGLGIVGFLLTEVTLSTSTQSSTLTPFLMVVDMAVFAVCVCVACWLYWIPRINSVPRLTVGPQGVAVFDYVDSRVPRFIPWDDIKQIEVDKPRPDRAHERPSRTLHVWYRPLRTVFSIRLSNAISLEDIQQLEQVCLKYVGVAIPVRLEGGTEPPKREFHRLLERLGKAPVDEGLLSEDHRQSPVDLSDEDFVDLVLEIEPPRFEVPPPADDNAPGN